MAKKSKKKDQADGANAATDAVDAIRAAVERTLQATSGSAQGTRDRTRGLFDEVVAAVGRIRDTVEELSVVEDLRGLRREVEALSRRVAQLEAARAAEAAAAPAVEPPVAAPASATPAASAGAPEPPAPATPPVP